MKMTLKKKFLHVTIKDLAISKFRFYAGIFVGLFASFSLYGFLYVMREVFRILSLTDEYDLWIFSEREVWFYNFFLACIGVIYGQSVCITYWLDMPRRWKDKIHRTRNKIVFDQRFQNWLYLTYFFRLASFCAILFCLTFKSWHYNFHIYPKYNIYLILFVVVLYLNSWLTIRILFKNQSFKWFVIFTFILGFMAFSFSKINLIDYKTINESILKKNVYYNYELEVPRSSYCQRVVNKSLVEKVFIALEQDSTGKKKTIFWTDGRKIGNGDLDKMIIDWKNQLHEMDQYRMTINVFAHNEINMGEINLFKQTLIKHGLSKTAFAVAPMDSAIDTRFSTDRAIYMRLPLYYYSPFFDPDVYTNIDQVVKNIVTITHSRHPEIICLNGNEIPVNELGNQLIGLIWAEPDYLISYRFTDSIQFGTYISVVSNVRLAYEDVREQYAIDKFGKSYNNLDWEENRKVLNRYQYNFIEMSDELMETLNVQSNETCESDSPLNIQLILEP